MGDTPYSGGEDQTPFTLTLSAEEMAQLAKIDDAVFTTAQWLFLSLFTIADYYTGPQIDSIILSHTHDGRYYTEGEIDSMFAEHAALSHTHDDRYYTEDEIDSLLSDKSDTTHNHDLVYAALSHNHDSAYAALSHTHDDRYYTESEITTLLAGKSDSTHNHDSDYADISHTHDEDDLSLSDVTTGDVNTTRHGFCPKLPGGQELNLFLRMDGSWAEPESSGGDGDVTGPESAVVSDFPSFADTSGKIIQDSGYGPSSFAVAAKGVTNGDSHDHISGDGAAIAEGALSLSDVTTGNVNTSRHGFVPKAPNDTSQFLRGDGSWNSIPDTARFVSNFVVKSGSSVTAGKIVEYINGFVRPGNGQNATSTTPITIPSNIVYPVAELISENTFIFSWMVSGTYTTIYFCVATLSGTTLTFGATTSETCASNSRVVLVTYSATDKRFIAFYFNSSNYLVARAGTVSGTTITWGTLVTVHAYACTSWAIDAVYVSENKVAVAFRGQSSTYTGRINVCSMSGTTITVGAQNLFNVAASSEISINRIFPNVLMVIYKNEGGSNYATATIVTVSGTTSTVRSTTVVRSVVGEYFSIIPMGNGTGFIIYRVSSASPYFTYVYYRYNVTSYTLTLGTHDDFIPNGVAGTYPRATRIGRDYILLQAAAVTTSYPTAILLAIKEMALVPIQSITLTSHSMTIPRSKPIVIWKHGCLIITSYLVSTVYYSEYCIYSVPYIVGMATESRSAGASVAVVISGKANYSGMTAGALYTADSDGRLQQWQGGMEMVVGHAISASEIVLNCMDGVWS